MIFSLQYLISKLDYYQRYHVSSPKISGFNIHSLYNLASDTIKDVKDGFRPQNQNPIIQHTKIDIKQLPILPIGAYFQKLEV